MKSKTPFKVRSNAAKKAWATRNQMKLAKARSKAAKKAWATRRAKQAGFSSRA